MGSTAPSLLPAADRLALRCQTIKKKKKLSNNNQTKSTSVYCAKHTRLGVRGNPKMTKIVGSDLSLLSS